MSEKEGKSGYANHPERKAAYAPYIPNGAISLDELTAMIETFRKEGAEKVKLGGELIFVWDTNHLPHGIRNRVGYDQNHFNVSNVRPVKVCSAETFCRRFRRPILGLAGKLDAAFRGMELPVKLVIGIAGCQRSCSEPGVKDIGLIAQPNGFEMLVGGSAGLVPRVARSIGLFRSEDEVFEGVMKIIEYIKKKDRQSIRLGKLLEKEGMDELLEMLGRKRSGS